MTPTRPVIHSDPDILGGTPVFRGTRVPFQALVDYLQGSHTLDEFLDDFPTASRDLALQAIENRPEIAWSPMRVLLDECVPRPLRRDLEGFDVKTVEDMGWKGIVRVDV